MSPAMGYAHCSSFTSLRRPHTPQGRRRRWYSTGVRSQRSTQPKGSDPYIAQGVRPIHSDIQRFRNHAIKGIISAQCLLSNTTKQKADPTFLKHGIEFSDAQKLWTDTELLEIPARTDDEARSLVIGRIDGKHWSAVITYRGSDIRLISVRRSRTEEVALYESQDV